jgi:hypothetical protein
MATEMESDKGTGLVILFGALALCGAGVMAVGHGTPTAGYGFAAAMVAAALAVVAIHVYE